MHFRLFNKPAAFGIKAGLRPMWIDGLYDDYNAGSPYEGRVQIHGSVGLMTLEILDSNIPPGSSVYIDQLTKEVVVKWATYTPPIAIKRGVPNGNFEDSSYWELVGDGTPAHIETGWSPNNKGNLTYRDQKGDYIVRGAWAPAGGVNQKLTITGKVEHGKSSKGNASCAIGLAWYNANRELVREDFGDPVTNGGKGRWYDVKLDGFSSNRDIKFVRPAIKFGRKKQNHPIHIGQVEWDHVYEEGYDSDEVLFVHVRVTDSTHNVAEHRGEINEFGVWGTSALMEVPHEEGYGISGYMSQLRTGIAPQPLEQYIIPATMYRFTSRAPLTELPTQPHHAYVVGNGTMTKLTSRVIRRDLVTQPHHAYTVGGGKMTKITAKVVRRDLPLQNPHAYSVGGRMTQFRKQ